MNYIDEIFGVGGYVSKMYANYVPRQGQIALAKHIDQGIRDGRHVFAEAGTGTGKSLAYAVPAIYHTKNNGTKALIVTANIALQEQLVNKDLPLLQKALAGFLPFSYALMKGTNNYLCLRDSAAEKKKEQLFTMRPDSPHAKLRVWAETTKTGDKSELAFQPGAAWGSFATNSEDCDGKECTYAAPCFARRARKIAKDADIIVANYHLLFMHYKTGGFLFPEFETLIMDEGHKAVDIARDLLGESLTENALKGLASSLDDVQKRDFHKACSDFFGVVTKYAATKYKTRIKEPVFVESLSLGLAIQELTKTYGKGISNIEHNAERDEENESLTEDAKREYEKQIKKLQRKLKRAQHILSFLRDVMSLKENRVFTIEFDEDKKPQLRSRIVDVSKELASTVFATPSATLTSATLTVGGSFEYLTKNLGVANPSTLVALSPFTLYKQALLIVPEEGVPLDQKNPIEFKAVVSRKLAETIKLADGRTLALFTSLTGMNAAYAEAVATGYRILKQGEMSSTKLVEEFRRDTHSVLMGLETFWAGVDVPGEALSCVFIDKLPFANLEDPILDVLGKNGFEEYSLPKAAIQFRQAFGRLIRTITDKGVVVCLDRRIIIKHGFTFLSELAAAKVQVSKQLSDVNAWLNNRPLAMK